MRICAMLLLASVLAGCGAYCPDCDYDNGYDSSSDNGSSGEAHDRADRPRHHDDGYHRDGDAGGYRPGGERDDGYNRDGDHHRDRDEGHHGRR